VVEGGENKTETKSKSKERRRSMAESVGVGGLGVTGSTLPSFSLTRHHTSTPNISLFFRSQSHFPAFRYFTRYNPHLYAAVTSDSKATSLDLTQPDLDHTGGGSDGKGNGNGSGGGGGGGSGGGEGADNNKGEEGSDSDKKKMAMLMSQKFTLAYAALVGGTSHSLSLSRISLTHLVTKTT